MTERRSRGHRKAQLLARIRIFRSGGPLDRTRRYSLNSLVDEVIVFSVRHSLCYVGFGIRTQPKYARAVTNAAESAPTSRLAHLFSALRTFEFVGTSGSQPVRATPEAPVPRIPSQGRNSYCKKAQVAVDP